MANSQIRTSDSGRRVLILGLGNPLRGDDGVGPRVVAELRRRGLPEGVEAVDGGTLGLDLLYLLEGWDQVIIVDAAILGRNPGEFLRFTPEDAHLVGSLASLSSHSAGLAETLALARALGRALPEIIIYGIQPERMDWEEGLSPAVEAALPRLVKEIRKHVMACSEEGGKPERPL
ncbi:MAG: hydrogenase maturation protease [Anaerolineae bacterium]|nr:hydrogenase maturation protease [Anaerolineae bacterium]MCX8066751.1 hydrogenase maturation protease [Anaerolineae bacterium]MDW7990659.1 hydrogenase maturation protease [Anaerolineae bacterium]